jgi:hypothetical protein
MVGTFTKDRWTAAHLMGLGDRHDFFQDLIFGYTKRRTRPGDGWNMILILLLACGAVASVRISPPFFLSLSMMMIGFSFAMIFNEPTKPLTSRYFAIPGLADGPHGRGWAWEPSAAPSRGPCADGTHASEPML